MTTNELYNIAARDNVIIIDGTLQVCPSLSLCDNGNCTVVVDYSQLDTEPPLRVCFAHELGHCSTGAFYTQYSYLDLRSRCEYRADKWAIKKLIPYDDMVSAIDNGYTEVWQLAELFGVTDDYIRKAYWIYFDKII